MTQFVLTASDWLNIGGMLDSLRSVVKRIRAERKIQKTIEELEKLTDKELNDIGIGRGDIRRVAMECYYDNRT